MVEKFHRVGAQSCNVVKCVSVGVAVDQRVGQINGTLLGVDDVEGGKMLVGRTDTNNFLGHFDDACSLGVKTGDKGIGIARFYHHHTKVIALVHLVVCNLQGAAVAAVALSENACIFFAFAGHGIVTQIDNLNTGEVEV